MINDGRQGQGGGREEEDFLRRGRNLLVDCKTSTFTTSPPYLEISTLSDIQNSLAAEGTSIDLTFLSDAPLSSLSSLSPPPPSSSSSSSSSSGSTGRMMENGQSMPMTMMTTSTSIYGNGSMNSLHNPPHSFGYSTGFDYSNPPPLPPPSFQRQIDEYTLFQQNLDQNSSLILSLNENSRRQAANFNSNFDNVPLSDHQRQLLLMEAQKRAFDLTRSMPSDILNVAKEAQARVVNQIRTDNAIPIPVSKTFLPMNQNLGGSLGGGNRGSYNPMGMTQNTSPSSSLPSSTSSSPIVSHLGRSPLAANTSSVITSVAPK